MSVNYRRKSAGLASGQMRLCGFKPVHISWEETKRMIDAGFRYFKNKRLVCPGNRKGKES